MTAESVQGSRWRVHPRAPTTGGASTHAPPPMKIQGRGVDQPLPFLLSPVTAFKVTCNREKRNTNTTTHKQWLQISDLFISLQTASGRKRKEVVDAEELATDGEKRSQAVEMLTEREAEGTRRRGAAVAGGKRRYGRERN